MSAIHRHFDRLRALVGDTAASELEAAYRADAAQDSRDSRQRQRERWKKEAERRNARAAPKPCDECGAFKPLNPPVGGYSGDGVIRLCDACLSKRADALTALYEGE